jgi:2-polyprenyl-6-methoxyphenol hydroxylase-like FAD-dependent oxidoreductase
VGYGVSHHPARRPDLGCRHRRSRVGLLAGPPRAPADPGRAHRGLWTGGHAVDIRGTALEVVERMGLDAEVRDARTQLLRLSAVRPDGRRTYDVALRPMHEMRGDREIEMMRDDLVRILYSAVGGDVEVLFGDSVRALVRDGDERVGVEFDHGLSREVDLVVGADGQHSTIRELAFGPERSFTHHLGAYLSIFTVDNLLGLTDQAVLQRTRPCRGDVHRARQPAGQGASAVPE